MNIADVRLKTSKIPTIIHQINKLNIDQDASSFEQIWANNEDFFKQMRFITSSWQAFQPFCQQEIEKFQDIMRDKFLRLNQFQLLLPNLSQFITFISKVNDKYQQKKVSIPSLQSIPDLLFKEYMHYIAKGKNRQCPYIRNDYGQKILFYDHIAQSKKYENNRQLSIRWQSIFRRIQSHFNFTQISCENENKLMDDFLGDIENDKIPSVECIGCCRYFFTDTNIYYDHYNNTELVIIGAVFKMKELETKLKNQVCRLLNGNGGIILFDCVKKYRDILPKGELLIPQIRAQIQQRITSFMESIYPRPQPANFIINFVPIAKNPLQQLKKPQMKRVTDGSTFQSSYFERQFIDGFYVTRIKIQPINGQKLFFWVNDLKPIFPVQQNGQINFIVGKNISKMIKKRFKKYYIPQNAQNIKQLKLRRPKLSHFHVGKCDEPSLGVELSGMYRRPEQLQMNDFQKQFKDISMVLARRSDLAYIKQRLGNKGHRCEINPKFTEYKFKFSSTSALIYHDLRFDNLLNEISNRKQFQFAGKYTKLLCITTFIKLDGDRIMSREKLQQVQDFFHKQYPNEQIKLWRYNNDGQRQFYFQVDRKSKLKTVFLFYILSDLGEKVAFKNPKNFDKLTRQMVNSRFRLQYPVNSKLQNKYLIDLYYEGSNSSANSFNGSQSR